MQDHSFIPPNSPANESGYDTGLADSVQGATAVEETAVILQIQMRGNAARAPIAGWLFRWTLENRRSAWKTCLRPANPASKRKRLE
jgi:hypothetical protein